MKRLSFLAALFGGSAAAQTSRLNQAEKTLSTADVPLPPGTYPGYGCIGPGSSWRCPAVNNECPVCGTMADPWSRPIHRKGEMMPTQCGPDGACLTAIFYYQEDTPYGPFERITRCRKCNAAFWQDAVKGGE